MGGRIPIANEAAYNAAKYAMCGFAEAMLLDLAGTGVDVKLVLPGPDRHRDLGPARQRARAHRRREGAAEDCAAGIADAIEDDGFEYYMPPVFPGGIDAKEIAVGKTQHCDQYLRGMADFTASLRGRSPTPPTAASSTGMPFSTALPESGSKRSAARARWSSRRRRAPPSRICVPSAS